MKKFMLSFSVFICIVCSFAYARIEPCALNFKPQGDGVFIYENNIESVTREDLSDTSNPNPSYIMKNTNLKPGKYSVFITNLNFTGLKDENGEIAEKGFSIELDGLFETDDKAVVKITSLGFEMPGVKTLYSNANKQKYEDSWSCLGAWSTYLKCPIYGVGSYRRYYPESFLPVQFGVNSKKKVWISEFIKNYAAVPYLKPVNILMDFEVLSGNVDFDIAALKSTGVLKDRSHHDYNAADGSFKRERQYKGIAATLPKVSANLSFSVNDGDRDGDFFPVTVYNQYNTAGKLTDKWVTNLNPQNDKWSRDICAESDMLKIKYFDPSKLDLYGDGVSDSKKTPWWFFDVFHTDTTYVSQEKNAQSENKFIPNRTVSRYEDNLLEACNLGNYGVRVNYKVSIKNNCNYDRYVYYNLETGSNNIVILYDENKNPVYDFALSKGNKADGTPDTMACVKLEKNKTTKFYIDVILPANNNGGMLNSLVLKDTPYEITFDERAFEVAKKGMKTDGDGFIVWNDSRLYKTYDLSHYSEIPLSDKAKEIFGTEGENFDIAAGDNGYIAKWGAYDGAPSYFADVLKFYNKVYIFDKDFNLVSESEFEDYPTEIAYSSGKYYVCAGGKNYYSEDGVKWHSLSTVNIPLQNGGTEISSTKYGYFFMSPKNMPFLKIDFEGSLPKYIEKCDNVFYYTDFDTLYLSDNGVYFEKINLGCDIVTVDKIGDEMLINNEKRVKIPYFEKRCIVALGNEIIGFAKPPVYKENEYFVSARRLLEKSDCDLIIDEQTGEITVKKVFATVNAKIGSDTYYLNGGEIKLGAPYISDGEIYLPLSFFEKCMGFKSEKYEDINFIRLYE